MRNLTPCGTPAAYRRHLRNGESACESCKAAVAKQKMERLDGDRETRKVSSLIVADAPVSHDEPEPPLAIDPRADAIDNLRIVNAALANAVPREVSALSKRRQELVTLIVGLGGKKEVSIADQLAARRERRRSRTSTEASS